MYARKIGGHSLGAEDINDKKEGEESKRGCAVHGDWVARPASVQR
jgi:hypothetical protein